MQIFLPSSWCDRMRRIQKWYLPSNSSHPHPNSGAYVAQHTAARSQSPVGRYNPRKRGRPPITSAQPTNIRKASAGPALSSTVGSESNSLIQEVNKGRSPRNTLLGTSDTSYVPHFNSSHSYLYGMCEVTGTTKKSKQHPQHASTR